MVVKKKEEDGAEAKMNSFSGSCVCNSISFEATNLKDIWYCHCKQCRNITGHYMAASQVKLKNINIKGKVKWFYVSNKARHGFCPDCGSQLFWRNDDNDYMSVCAGSLDDSKCLAARGHVFVKEKAKYYDITDNLAQYETWWSNK